MPYKLVLIVLTTLLAACAQPPEDDVTVLGAGGRITVTNVSTTNVCYVYIEPAPVEEWGEDRLAPMEIIRRGETKIFSVDPGEYELRALSCERGHFEETRFRVQDERTIDIDMTTD